ncbi:MAG TPA: ABC transporter ATP-binding protein [Candidatus Choladousia intestinigallinarum]|nr:ABC transporter ATP-binding protein [Candidatus Choladousia intestinigallinarum]
MEILQVKQVHKIYGEKENKVYALRDVSFSVEQGAFIAVVGTSGSGKSTLLNLIGGLDTPTQGEIVIRGRNIGALKRKELTIFRRRNIGFVFQDYSLMPVLNVYDNVALPVTFDKGKHIDCPYIQELLRELGLWEKRTRYPSELSGGQQQRVALARALANKPALILADEPTGNLDSGTTVEVMGLLKESSRRYHQTILMVTHNEALAQATDGIIRIEDGRVQL